MPELYRFPFTAMGTSCSLSLYASSQERAARFADVAVGETRRVEARYSRYDPASFLSEINHTAREGGAISVDAETAGMLDYAFACHEASGGLFDITSGILRKTWNFDAGAIPEKAAIEALLPRVGMDKISWDNPVLTFTVPGMELDFGGIGKEYAADRVAEVLQQEGARHGLIELGGDICVIGPHPDGSPWIIDITDPRAPGSHMGTLALTEGALASSGDYERFIDMDGTRYSHLLDPRTGWPVRGLTSVSVVAETCVVAGSLSTIAMLKGEGGAAWLADIEARSLWVDANGNEGGSFHGDLK